MALLVEEQKPYSLGLLGGDKRFSFANIERCIALMKYYFMSNTLFPRDLDTDIEAIYSEILRVNYTPEDFEGRFLQLPAIEMGNLMHWT